MTVRLTRFCWSSCQQVRQLLEAILAGGNVVISGIFQKGPLSRVNLIQVDAAALVQRVEPVDDVVEHYVELIRSCTDSLIHVHLSGVILS